MTANAIELLAEAADPRWVQVDVDACTSTRLVCDVSAPLYDGDDRKFRLVFTFDTKGQLRVREEVPGQSLPASCPERHINYDGGFCLGWGPSAPALPQTEDDAAKYWAVVHGFLKLQIRASLTRHWPVEHAWPHGAAANARLAFETAASRLPLGLRHAVERGDVCLAGDTSRVERRSGACPCGSGRAMKRCHEADLVQLVDLLKRVRLAEDDFWDTTIGTCCGTMDGCRMKPATLAGDENV